MRTPLQDSMPIDFQMPLVATSTPQSQPKFDVGVVVDVRQLAPVQGGQALGGGDGRVEGDDELVRARSEQVPDGEPVRAVLVGGGRDDDAVELDRGEGVEALGDEVVACLVRRGPLERAAVAPDGVADPLGGGLAVAVERVGDPAGPQQVGVHAAGDLRLDRFAVLRRLLGPGHRLEGPRAVQGGPLHCVSSSLRGRDPTP
jgi:hypothetical protein